MQQSVKQPLTAHQRQVLSKLQQAWKDYHGDLMGDLARTGRVTLPVPTVEAFARKFTALCDAEDLHGAQELFQNYVNANEGREYVHPVAAR